MYCSNCGKQVSDTALFCANCGAKVRAAEVAPEPRVASEVLPIVSPSLEPENKPKKKKTGFIVAVIVILLLALSGVGVYLYFNSDVQKCSKMVTSAEELIDDEEYEDAVAILEEVLEMNEEDEDAIELLKEAYEALAEEYLAEGEDKKAGKILKKLAVLEGDDDDKLVTEPETTPEPTPEPTSEPISEPVIEEKEGKVLNIYCWNDEFKTRMEDYYPGYERIDYRTGKIGDVTIQWSIIYYEDNAYQNNLDFMLLCQDELKADEKVDMFLIEPMYALKYVDSVYTMDLDDLGITEADLANQYDYTKEVATSSYGELKGLTWQAHSGVLFYNREIAKEVLGSDDPAYVQQYVADWETFLETAELMNKQGYDMVSSVFDTYRTYSQNATTPWVVDGRVNIDQSMLDWVEDSKYLLDMDATNTHGMWTAEWYSGAYQGGNVFCYFGPDWLVRWSMRSSEEESISYNGGWAATEGPQGFFWGGAWICAATGTDNEELVRDIMLTMTANTDILQEMVIRETEFVNDKNAMESFANGECSHELLGGQNPMSVYVNNAERIDMSNTTAYDEGCNEMFQSAMTLYFDGTCSYEDALEFFYKNVFDKYPELYR